MAESCSEAVTNDTETMAFEVNAYRASATVHCSTGMPDGYTEGDVFATRYLCKSGE